MLPVARTERTNRCAIKETRAVQRVDSGQLEINFLRLFEFGFVEIGIGQCFLYLNTLGRSFIRLVGQPLHQQWYGSISRALINFESSQRHGRQTGQPMSWVVVDQVAKGGFALGLRIHPELQFSEVIKSVGRTVVS